MTRAGFLWLPLAFAIVLVAIGIPFWQVPYNADPFAQASLLPGVVLLAVTPVLLVGGGIARARWTFIAMSMCIPVIDMAVIARDTAIDPTSHNLAPIELVYLWGIGAMFLVPGLVLGLVFRSLLRRSAA